MASILLHADRLEIKLTAAEKMLARRKDDVVIPRESIRSVSLTDDPWIWIRGVRAPGTAFPLTLAVGQWKFHGGKDFLLLKGSRPAVVIDLIDEEFRRVLVSTRNGLELIAALRLEERKPRKVRVHMAQPRTKAVASVTTLPTAKKSATKKPAPKKPTAKNPASTPQAAKPAPVKSSTAKRPKAATAPAAETGDTTPVAKKPAAAKKPTATKKPTAAKKKPADAVPSGQAAAATDTSPSKPPAKKKPSSTGTAKKPPASKPAPKKQAAPAEDESDASNPES